MKMADETNTQTITATPAADGVTATTEPTTGKAPSSQESAAAASVAEATNTGSTSGDKASPASNTTEKKDDLPKGVKRRLWEQAEQIRALKERIEANERAGNPLSPQQQAQAQATAINTETPPAGDLLDNPAEWAKRVEANATKNAEKNVLATMAQEREVERLKKENDEAYTFLLDQKDVSDSEDAPVEIAEILRQPEFAYVAAKYPKKAAKMALEAWREDKGIGAVRKEAIKGMVSASTSTTATAQNTGVKTWTRNTVEAYIAAGNTAEEMTKRRQEIQTAFREGRVK
jgi:hypothetical protein